uniref:Uncharacterized protein n=1 Tax=Chrysolophus pictus TaxID=9089 RepID=A0A8C3LV95_CHRPC
MGHGEGWEDVGWGVFLKLLSRGGGGAGNGHHSSSRSAELHRCQTSTKQRPQRGGSDPPGSCPAPSIPAVCCTARRHPDLPPPGTACEPAWQGLNSGFDSFCVAKTKANRRISWKFTFLTSSLLLPSYHSTGIAALSAGRALLAPVLFRESVELGGAARMLQTAAVKPIIQVVIGTGVATGAVLVGVPLAVWSLGFTAAGITAGSIGAKMMSAAAIANGGGVAAGSIVAVLQSVGAAGLSLGVKLGLASVFGPLGALIGSKIP